MAINFSRTNCCSLQRGGGPTQSTDAKQMSGLRCKRTGHSEAEVARSVSVAGSHTLGPVHCPHPCCHGHLAHGPSAPALRRRAPRQAARILSMRWQGASLWWRGASLWWMLLGWRCACCLCPPPWPTHMLHPHAFTMELIFCSLLISFSPGFP